MKEERRRRSPLPAAATSMCLASCFVNVAASILWLLLVVERPAPGSGGQTRAGPDPCAPGRSVCLGDATAPIRKRSIRREVT